MRSFLLAITLVSACGGEYVSARPSPPNDMDRAPPCIDVTLRDGLSGMVDVTTLHGKVSHACDGSYACGSDDWCRIEFVYSQRGAAPLAPVVQTAAGVVNISKDVGVLGITTNGATPIARLSLCSFNADFAYLYVAMSKGAKVSSVEFIKSAALCQ